MDEWTKELADQQADEDELNLQWFLRTGKVIEEEQDRPSPTIPSED